MNSDAFPWYSNNAVLKYIGSRKWWGSDQNDKVSNFCGGAVGDQMEIDPNLYKSSPQSTSHPLFAHRYPPTSLSSTESFLYGGAWFTPVAHTASMRKGFKPSWVWAYGEELRDTKGRKY
jgi:hypothetical protein